MTYSKPHSTIASAPTWADRLVDPCSALISSRLDLLPWLPKQGIGRGKGNGATRGSRFVSSQADHVNNDGLVPYCFGQDLLGPIDRPLRLHSARRLKIPQK
jgi:hypothetical protein